MFQEQWEVPAGFTSWLLRFAFGVPVSLILLLSRVNDAQFSLSQGNAWISGGLEPSILCCHCPSPVSPPSALSLSEKSSSFLNRGAQLELGDQIRKRHLLQDGKQRVFLEWISAISCSSISRQERRYNHGCGCVQGQVGQRLQEGVRLGGNSWHRPCRQHPSFQPVLHEETAG